MRVRVSEEARKFLRTEVEYLRHRSPPQAHRLLDRMRQAMRNLGDFAMMGSAADEGLVPGTRRLIVGEYVLTYDVSDSHIEVFAIRHGRMQASTPDADEDFDYEAQPSTIKP